MSQVLSQSTSPCRIAQSRILETWKVEAYPPGNSPISRISRNIWWFSQLPKVGYVSSQERKRWESNKFPITFVFHLQMCGWCSWSECGVYRTWWLIQCSMACIFLMSLRMLWYRSYGLKASPFCTGCNVSSYLFASAPEPKVWWWQSLLVGSYPWC